MIDYPMKKNHKIKFDIKKCINEQIKIKRKFSKGLLLGM